MSKKNRFALKKSFKLMARKFARSHFHVYSGGLQLSTAQNLNNNLGSLIFHTLSARKLWSELLINDQDKFYKWNLGSKNTNKDRNSLIKHLVLSRYVKLKNL